MFQNKARIVGFVVVALVLASGTFFIRSNHKKDTKKAEASSNTATITTQAEWEGGALSNINTTSVAGSIKINDIASQNNYLSIVTSEITASPDTGKGNIVDADNCSSWNSVADDSNVVIDLGQQISGGYIDWLSQQPWGNTFGGFYNPPYFSADGTNWDVLSATHIPTTAENSCYHDAGTFRMIEGPASFRYIKIQTFPGLSGNPVNDLKVYTTGALAKQITAPTQVDGGANFWQWENFTDTKTVPANTSVTYRFRTSTNGSDWTGWVGSIGAVTSRTGDDSNNPTKYRYLQIEATLSNTDGASTPTIDQYDIGYHTNQPPNKPTAMTAVIQ